MYTRADLAPDQPGLEPLIPVLELLLIFFSRSATVHIYTTPCIIPVWSDYGMKTLARQRRANTMPACLFTEKKSYSLIGHGEEYS